MNFSHSKSLPLLDDSERDLFVMPLSQSEARMDYKRFFKYFTADSNRFVFCWRDAAIGKRGFRRKGINLENPTRNSCSFPHTVLSTTIQKYLPNLTTSAEVHDNHGDQWRSEVSDGFGHVHGSYGFVDSDGMRREVKYVADDGGFRAHIKTNEPGMDMPNPADVVVFGRSSIRLRRFRLWT
ncbi:uncharacterized protein CEXT_6201 [Caerostris extrusa]|uniref:Uncharacterized protein n=1 Tax=Caerostris extrusa TaxID=172846 RepID=A0AAV4VCZ6_CAEEX|nr:uncharacterized protein CEXT_6201 [Caerostris extrusa]